jgi:ATP-binding cassette subfamily F protein uup
LLLVSHDRAFLDNVVTSLIVFTGDGHVEEFFGGYAEWQEYQKIQHSEQNIKPVAKAPVTEKKPAQAKNKLSYKDQRELDALPEQMDALEARIAELTEKLSDPDIYQKEAEKASEYADQLTKAESDLEAAFERWETLESMQTA